MDEMLAARFEDLLKEGATLVSRIAGNDRGHLEYWIDDQDIPKCQRWLCSVANLLDVIGYPGSLYQQESRKLLEHHPKGEGIASAAMQKMLGLLASARDEWRSGLLRKVEHMVAAATFDDFLDHAATYHKGNKKNEAAVLASAVLEDALKRIARKSDRDPSGQSLEEVTEMLVKAGVFTTVKAKRVKGMAGVRNHALHAEWDKFDIKDVGHLISQTRELLEDYL
jgi:uncharacterized protein YutE (UPF0331/DUF86 family)